MKRFVHSFYNGKEQLVGVKIHSFSRNPFHSCLIIIACRISDVRYAMLFVEWRFANRIFIKQLSCHKKICFVQKQHECLLEQMGQYVRRSYEHRTHGNCLLLDQMFFFSIYYNKSEVRQSHVRTSSVCQSATVSIRFVWKGRKYRLLCAHQPHKIR